MTANTAVPLQRPLQGRHKPAPPRPTAGGVRARATLADFASIMGANFDALPPRIRYRPLSKAIWAALMLDVGMLRVFVARATNPTDGSLAGLLEALDMVAARLVLAAIGGDMRAAKLIMDLIDGPVRSKAGRNNGAGPRSAGDEADRERAIAGLVMAYEQALAATARG
ncbi:MAG: hypothetical protein WCI21_08325 [Alphaproteobacteria bacterium]